MYTEPFHAGIGSQGGQPDPQLNPDPTFFFEERVNWPALVRQIPGCGSIAPADCPPRSAWEYAQRGMYKQDELENIEAAVEDYRKSEEMNNRIQIVQARLGVIEKREAKEREEAKDYEGAVEHAEAAIEHFDHILEEAPFHQGVPFLLGEAYEIKYKALKELGRADDAAAALAKAEEEFKGELRIAPASQRTHLALAELFIEEGRDGDALPHLETYLCQAQWNSDQFPVRILKARKEREELGRTGDLQCAEACVELYDARRCGL
jgi:tetratricopeptide (TPR) repeat protein